jgi:hypothetical protein
MKKRPPQRGFIALISIIIIGAILAVLMYTLDTGMYFSRFDALSGENKRESLALAESCVHAALLKLAQNSSYVPGATGDKIAVDTGKNCTICAVLPNIVTRASYNAAFTTITATGTLANGVFTVSSWQENTSNTVPACTNM